MFLHYLGLSTLFPYVFGNKGTLNARDEEKEAELETAVNDETVAASEEHLDAGSDAVEMADHFPLMDLPPELITEVLGSLPIVDRLRARVNRTLYRLEAGDEYWAKKMVIARAPGSHLFHNEDIPIKLRGPRSAFVPALAKLASNVSVEYLKFQCEPSDVVLIPHVKSIRAECLVVSLCDHEMSMFDRPQNHVLGPREMTDANLEEWIGQSKFLSVHGAVALTGERLFQLYNDMVTHRSPLLSFQQHDAQLAESRKVVELLGITYVDGQFHSTREDVEIYLEHLTRASSMSFGHYMIIIGSKMRISINKTSLELPTWPIRSEFTMERHNEDGSVPEELKGNYAFYLSIEDIRSQEKRFGRVPVIYSN